MQTAPPVIITSLGDGGPDQVDVCEAYILNGDYYSQKRREKNIRQITLSRGRLLEMQTSEQIRMRENKLLRANSYLPSRNISLVISVYL